MALIDDLRKANPNLQRFSDQEIVQALRNKPQFQNLSEEEFGDQVFGSSAATQQKDDDSPGFMAGLSAGVDQLQALYGGLKMAMGEASEDAEMLSSGRDIYQLNMEEAAQNDLGFGFTDIRSAGDAWQWARYTAGNQLPMLAASIAGGGVGGLAAGQGAKMLAGAAAKQTAARIGQALGAAGTSIGMETGSLMGQTEDLDVALAHGALAGSLDAVAPIRALRSVGAGKLADKAASDIADGVLSDLAKQARRSTQSAAVRGIGTNLLTEASTEGLQGLIEQHANYWVANNGESLLANLGDVDLKALVDEAAAGGLMGGALGAPVGVLERNQARTQVAHIESAKQEVAAQGGDVLDQAIAGQNAEQSNPVEPEPVDPAITAELGNRIQLAMSELDELQAMAKGSTYQGQTRLRTTHTMLDRAEKAFTAGNAEQAQRFLNRYQQYANNLRADLSRAGTAERPAQVEGELVDDRVAGALPGGSPRLPPATEGVIYGEGPTADTTAYEPQARNVRRDEAMTAQRAGASRLREQMEALRRRPQLTDQQVVYGQGPVAGNANTGLDQPFADPRFTPQAEPMNQASEEVLSPAFAQGSSVQDQILEGSSVPASELQAQSIAGELSPDQIRDEINDIDARVDQRWQEAVSIAGPNDRINRLDYATPEEAERLHLLKQALPSFAQERAEARTRVRERLADRQANRQRSTQSLEQSVPTPPKRRNKPLEYTGYSGESRQVRSYDEVGEYRVAKVHSGLFEVIDAQGRAVSQMAGRGGAIQHAQELNNASSETLARAVRGESASIDEALERDKEVPRSEVEGNASSMTSSGRQDSPEPQMAEQRQPDAQLVDSTPEQGKDNYSLSSRKSEEPLSTTRAVDITDAVHGIPELADVKVIQSASELPAQTLVGMALRGISPSDVRGTYVNGDLYVVADNLTSVQEGIEVAVHEAVGHKGMRAVLGEQLEPVMLSLYRSLPNSKEGRAALREVLAEYSFLDPSNRDDRITIGEEMVAHLLEKGHRPKAWQRAVARIRALLRKLFPMIGWSYTDVLALGERSRDYLRRRQARQADPTITRYSQRQGENKLFTPIQQEAEAYRKELDRSLSSLKSWTPPIPLGRTPPVLACLGAPDLPMFITRDVVRKATNGVKHDVRVEDIAQLPELLHDPIAIFQSRTEGDAFVIWVDATDQNGKPVIAALHLKRREGRQQLEINRVASVYGDKSGGGKLSSMVQSGLMRYMNTKKNPDLVRRSGVQFPGRGSPNQGRSSGPESPQSSQLQLPSGEEQSQNLGSSVLSPDDIGNTDLYSLGGRHRVPDVDQFDDLDADQQAFLGKIGAQTPTQRGKAWLKETFDRWQTKVRQGVVDQYAALKEQDEKLLGESMLKEDIRRSSWVRARMSGAASGAVHVLLNNGRIRWDAKEQVISTVDDDSKGLGSVLAQLGKPAEINRFMAWIAANRSDKLHDEGREFLFTENEIAAGKKLSQGQLEDGSSRAERYDAVFREFQQYRDDVLSIAEQAGIITSEQRSMWADEFYVPFYRINEDDKATGLVATSGLSRQQAYKKLKGGKHNLNDLLQNTMMNFHHLVDASLKNLAAQQAVENAKALGMAEVVPESVRDPKNSTFVMEKGRKVFYQIDDPMVFSAVTALAHPGMNSTAMKVMRAFKRVFTNTTTVTPQFVVANLIRDSLQATATSDVSKNALGNILVGHQNLRDDIAKARMLASGASFHFGHLYGNNPDELRAHISRGMRDAKVVDSPKAVLGLVRKGWDWWNDINNHAENLNRAAIYAQNAAEGNQLRAAFEARDLMDFSAHGAWPAVRILIDIVPFLNARIQGLDKIYRSGVKPGTSVLKEVFGRGDATATDKQMAGRFWAVTGALALATMALYLHNHDDEEYQKLEDWQKDSYWFMRFGDKAFFIPKPFEVGAIATLAERITEQFVDDQATGQLFRQRLGHMLFDTFSFSPVPQMMQPALDIYANYDAFTGRPIEGMGMDRLSPELRRRADTSSVATGISHVLNNTVGAIGDLDKNPLALSPVQVDHLIQGYFGQVGAWVTGVADTGWRAANGEEQPAKRWYEYQPIRRFYKNLGDEDRYTKYGTVFYEGMREAGRAYSDVKELREMGRLADAAELVKDKQGMLALRPVLNRAQRRLSTLNKQIDFIRKSALSSEEKRQRIDRLQAIKNQVQRALGEQVLEVRAVS